MKARLAFTAISEIPLPGSRAAAISWCSEASTKALEAVPKAFFALRDRFVVDCGAWNPIGAGVVYNTAVHLPGLYKIDAIAIEARIAATNKVLNAPYRGAGRAGPWSASSAVDGQSQCSTPFESRVGAAGASWGGHVW
jgi:Molybdopterin cofactor-binding domain